MNIKELKSLLKLLRQSGVLSYKTTDLELSLSADMFIREKGEEIPESPQTELTDEQLAFYSSMPLPDGLA